MKHQNRIPILGLLINSKLRREFQWFYRQTEKSQFMLCSIFYEMWSCYLRQTTSFFMKKKIYQPKSIDKLSLFLGYIRL